MTREVGGNVVGKYQADFGPFIGVAIAAVLFIALIGCCLCCCCMVAVCGVFSCCARSLKYKDSEREAEFQNRFHKED